MSKLAAFFLTFDASVSVLDGADLSSTRLTSFVFPEIEDLGFTQIHVANPSADPATVTFELLKSDDTARAPSVTRTTSAWGAVWELFAEMFPNVAATGSDYLRATSTRGVVPFELLGRTGRYVEGLDVGLHQGLLRRRRRLLRPVRNQRSVGALGHPGPADTLGAPNASSRSRC